MTLMLVWDPVLAARFETEGDKGQYRGRLTAVLKRRVASSIVIVYTPAADEALKAGTG